MQDGERTVTVRRVGGAQWLGAMFHAAAARIRTRPRSTRWREMMTVEPAGRLYKALVEGKKASSRRELDVSSGTIPAS